MDFMVIILALLICASAFFSATETAYTSVNKIRIKNMAAEGNKKAENTLKILHGFDALLSTLLIGNNIVNITSASIATVIYTNWLVGDKGVTVCTIVMKLLVLVFGEITPKSLATEMPEKFAMAAVPIVKVL